MLLQRTPEGGVQTVPRGQTHEWAATLDESLSDSSPGNTTWSRQQ